MKKTFFLLGSLALLALASCKDDDDNNNIPSGGTPPTTATSSNTVDVSGSITKDRKWSADSIYRLKGYVYVDNNSTLTIEAGTKIISNRVNTATNTTAGALVIYKGSKINAVGTPEKPIVFTSGESDPQPGDLGGLIIVGKATQNGNVAALEGGVDQAHSSFGGDDDKDNSGILQYVRIEYAGKAVSQNDEINGLSMYAVGSGTTVDHIEVVRGLDDAFEFFGGSFNASYLVAYNTADDDFDMDNGYHGKIQFAVSIKDPAFTDEKGVKGDISNNFEVDNTTEDKGYLLTPITNPIMSNFTAIGPNGSASIKPEKLKDWGYGMRWRRGCQFTLANSIVMGGQKAGLDIDNDPTAQYYKDGKSGFLNSLLQSFGPNYNVDKLTNSALLTADDLKNLVETRDGSKTFAKAEDIGLTDPFNNQAPNLAPKAGSAAATATASFTADALKDSFFKRTNYVGAIDPNGSDWTKESWVVYGK